jgi:phosphatidylglycerol:prolipoprotein diacylglycerol transferase
LNTTVGFPGLGLGEFPLNPTLVKIGPLAITWYGLLIAVGFLLAAVYAARRSRFFGIRDDDFFDLLFVATPVALVFARLYYAVFNWGEFRGDWTRVFRIWEGGIAIYGAVIGAALTVLVGCRSKKISVPAMLDLMSLGFLIGQAVGRWGNFVNGEVYGQATDVPWRMSVNGYAVHPLFLYESLWCALGFALLHFLSKKRVFNGQIFLCYVAWYGLGRGVLEGMRDDQFILMLFNTPLRVSQVLGFASCVLALGTLFFLSVFRRHDPQAVAPLAKETPAEPAGEGEESEGLEETEVLEEAEDFPAEPFEQQPADDSEAPAFDPDDADS